MSWWSGERVGDDWPGIAKGVSCMSLGEERGEERHYAGQAPADNQAAIILANSTLHPQNSLSPLTDKT